MDRDLSRSRAILIGNAIYLPRDPWVQTAQSSIRRKHGDPGVESGRVLKQANSACRHGGRPRRRPGTQLGVELKFDRTASYRRKLIT
jgi:hypothetical protein